MNTLESMINFQIPKISSINSSLLPKNFIMKLIVIELSLFFVFLLVILNN